MKILSNKLLIGSIILLAVFLVINVFLGRQYFNLRQQNSEVKQKVEKSHFLVEAVSDIPSFSLSIAEPDKLKNYLSDFGFLQENNVAVRETIKKATVKHLVVHLTDQVQEFDRLTSVETGVYQASGEIFNNDKFDLFIFISPWILEKEEEAKLSQRIDSQVLRTAYNLTHLDLETEARRQLLTNTVKNILNELSTNNQTLFKVRRIK